MVVETKIPIVDPDGVVLEGHPPEPLPVVRQLWEYGLDGVVDCRDVDASRAIREGSRLEDLGGDRVQVAPLVLDQQEGGALGGEALVLVRPRGLWHEDLFAQGRPLATARII
jgi:hypothetical protein